METQNLEKMSDGELYSYFCSLKKRFDDKREKLKTTDDLEMRKIIRKTMNDITRKINVVIYRCRKRGFYPIYLGYDMFSLRKTAQPRKAKKSPHRKKTQTSAKNAALSRIQKKQKSGKRASKTKGRNRNKHGKA